MLFSHISAGFGPLPKQICLLLCCVLDEEEENQDTVEQILKCIIENEGDKIKTTILTFCFILFNLKFIKFYIF